MFEAEARAKAGGDPGAGDIDLDHIRALQHDMPCTAASSTSPAARPVTAIILPGIDAAWMARW